MTRRRRWIVRLFLIGLVILTSGVGVLAYSAVMMAQVFQAMFEAAAPIVLAEMVIYLYATIVIEIAASLWAARGPIMALGWVIGMVVIWRGG